MPFSTQSLKPTRHLPTASNRVNTDKHTAFQETNTHKTATMGFMDSIRAKVELYRLEQRYARRDKRATTTFNARYVDGEYIFQDSPGSPTGSTGSWQHSTSSSKRSPAVKVKELMSKSVR
ncbi:hypothetical protein D6D02_00591 [Aureobasidium pullulans]|nr:hypothetical protein D6D02_00591 [Aureobasidium pullulans]